jgi:nucleoside-diphosphate-sugar epimerase
MTIRAFQGGLIIMDKAIIIGVYEYIGFQLCSTLLDQGVEVIGVHLNNTVEEELLEERRLEIGRNANFVELQDLSSITSIFHQVVILIDYYSYYRKRCEHYIETFILNELLSQINEKHANISILLPVQHLNKQTIFHVIELEKDRNLQRIYLPAIYGPRQPENYAFQQALLYPELPIEIDNREWVSDALFIEDAVNMIIKVAEERTQEWNLLLFKSIVEDHWQKAAEYLNIEKPEGQVNAIELEMDNEIVEVEVNATDIEHAIQLQKRYIEINTNYR